jgi:hypothetical protein
MGIIKIGTSESHTNVVIGILIFLSGFEIIYATVENSVFIAGSLALISLGIAILGSYLSITPPREVDL